MSKLVKGIKKGFKKIFKGVKKVFKKITKSFIGKIILAAVVIYTGGVLMGAWGSTGPMAGMHGAWAGGAAAPISTVAPSAVAPTAVAAPISTVAPLASTAVETASILEGATIAGTAPAAAGSIAPIASTAVETAAILEGAAPIVEETLLGSLWSGVKSASAYANENPFTASLLMAGVSSALTPDQPNQIDILREQDKLRRERYAGMGTFERTPRLSGRSPSMLYQQPSVPWHAQANRTRG